MCNGLLHTYTRYAQFFFAFVFFVVVAFFSIYLFVVVAFDLFFP